MRWTAPEADDAGMKLRALALVPPLAAALVVLGAPAPAGATACSTQQLTSTTGGTQDTPRISDDGTVVSWTSTRNLVGQNPDLNAELYWMDLTTGVVEQVTNHTGDEFLRGELSGDGDRVVFESRGEHGDGADNADGSFEVFLWDESGDAGDIQQLTNGDRDSHRPSINGDGTRIAFLSTADLTGGNANGNQEVHLRDTASSTTTQLTDTATGGSFFPLIDRSGTRVVFSADADLSGGTPDGGRDLFRHNVTTGVTSRLFDTDDVGIEPLAVDADASVIAYNAELDLTGANPDESYEIFVHRNGGGTTQVTDLPSIDHYAEFAALDAVGSRMSFHANADLVPGENPSIDDYQLFIHDAAGRVGFDQLTHSAEGTGDTDLSADGTRIVTDWRGDPLGANGDGNNEIFMFTCGAAGPTYTDVRPANFFYDQVEWMAAARVANGFPNGTFKPGDAVKRQQMANFLFNLAGRPEVESPVEPTFTDVPTSNPFYAQIEWMVGNGIATGFPGGRFKPGDPVKRQQMANFLYALAGSPDFTPPATPTFQDVPASNPFFSEIEWMTAEGIANGFPGGLYKPGDPVKRQQMAQFLLNLVNGPGIDLD
jgi:hypothetical protein